MYREIELKLNQIFNDFIEELECMDKYCNLKSFNFSSSNLPNYNDGIIQKYYLLRFMMAYFTEYYEIYTQLIRMNFLEERFNILSVGCGCGIDFWGLRFAKQQTNSQMNIRYTGLDIVDWQYWDSFNEEVYFINTDIRELQCLDENEYNIIIFPKSIGELDLLTFNQFKKAICNTEFNSNKLVIISSLRSTRTDVDKNRTKDIVQTLATSNMYSILDNLDTYWYFPKKENGWDYRIKDRINELDYPIEISNFMTSFYTNCQGYIDNNKKCCYSNCSKILGRFPITTMSQVKYQIIRLERV